MHYFAGPIILTHQESMLLLYIFVALLAVGIGVIALFVASIYRTIRAFSHSDDRGRTRLRTALTITLPIITVIIFLLWLAASMATHDARYASPDAFPISSLLAGTCLCLFALSFICAVYYMFKR